MQTWKGWTAATEAPSMGPFTWAEWCARHQGTLREEQRRQHGEPFSERELAHLAFVRWLCQTGRLNPLEFDDT
jgi:hypothetical protein